LTWVLLFYHPNATSHRRENGTEKRVFGKAIMFVGAVLAVLFIGFYNFQNQHLSLAGILLFTFGTYLSKPEEKNKQKRFFFSLLLVGFLGIIAGIIFRGNIYVLHYTFAGVFLFLAGVMGLFSPE